MTLEGHTAAATVISYFSDGKQIISGSRDKTVRWWDLEEGKEIEEARDVCEEGVEALAISRDGRWLLASGSGNAVWIWRLDTGKLVAGPLKRWHSDDSGGLVYEVRFSPDSKKLAVVTSSDDNPTRIYEFDTMTPQIVRSPLEQHIRHIRICTSYCADGKHMISGRFWDKTIRCWDPQTVIDLLDGEREEKPVFTSIAYFPNRKQIITGGPNEKSARRWDLQRAKEVGEARFVCEQEILAVTVSRDGRWVVIGGGDLRCGGPGELKACEVETGIVKTFEGHSSIVTCIDISADSTLLASGSIDHTVQIWNLDTGELVAGPFKLDSVDILGAVRFSQDSRKLAMNSAVGKSLEVWDIEAQALDVRVGKQYKTKNHIMGLSYCLDGRQIISGSRGTVRRWDMEAGKEIEEARNVCEQEVRTLAISRDGRWVVTSAPTPDLLRNHPRKIKATEVEMWVSYCLL
ncbi:YVTN repeat-like/Quino protein amine dehydrogenase [Rhizopogon vinicolor AM-OR11-026]|uniref:YVTN repeat-like/Quino protein amine dehydrogenase n=1 Tax=Rhizopogon vinicolor AM-OR11-026 TaxID=1314800 RepID=A0A1B7MK90_9AGAM|nr:YVTN repeat-like/Quino protein amine dehydrogenase [Rhizopogon vinicolor AM-OR11-026]